MVIRNIRKNFIEGKISLRKIHYDLGPDIIYFIFVMWKINFFANCASYCPQNNRVERYTTRKPPLLRRVSIFFATLFSYESHVLNIKSLLYRYCVGAGDPTKYTKKLSQQKKEIFLYSTNLFIEWLCLYNSRIQNKIRII